jgi:hypothetical protein
MAKKFGVFGYNGGGKEQGSKLGRDPSIVPSMR